MDYFQEVGTRVFKEISEDYNLKGLEVDDFIEEVIRQKHIAGDICEKFIMNFIDYYGEEELGKILQG